MRILSITELKKSLYEIVRLIENGDEDCVIVTRYRRPVLRITPERYCSNQRLGAGKGMFKVPDNFDEIDLSSDYTEEIFN